MAHCYRTDLDNLNKLYKINKYYNSPKIIRNYHSKERRNSNNIILEKSSSLPYFPTNVKLLKKNYFNSPIPDQRMDTLYDSYPYKTINLFYSRNNEGYLRPRNHNYSTDFINNAYKRAKNKNLEKINRLNYSYEGPDIINEQKKNDRFITISPSFNRIVDKDIDDNYNINNKNKAKLFFRNKIKSPITINNSISNNYKPYHTENNNINENYMNTLMNNSISYMTDINQYRAKQYNKRITKNSQYKQSKNNITKDNIFINNNIYYTDPNIQLDDLIIMEEKFNDIIIVLNNIRNNLNINAMNECVEFFLFYFNSSLKNKFVYFFSEQNHIIIHSALNVMLFMIMLTYHLSLNQNMLIKTILILTKIFDALKVNLYLFIKKIELYYGDSFCSKNEIYFNKFNYFLIKNGIFDLSEREIIDIISRNCVHAVNDVANILNYYKIINNRYYFDFQNIYLSLSKLNEDDLNDYFYNNLLNSSGENLNNKIYYDNDNINNIENSNIIIENSEEDENEYLNNIILLYKRNKAIPPFLKTKSNKKYTLVIDLGGTLVNVKMDNKGGTICYLRPGIISFLTGIKPYYEIVSYTKLSREYSNLIIQQIEKNKKLFDYNLYREHCTLVGNKFVKDISRIGRDMKKIIMVDDIPENLERFFENGILILPYEGEGDSEEDRVLFELKKLLILFYKIGYEDLRNAIKSYRNEIYDKITLGNVDY